MAKYSYLPCTIHIGSHVNPKSHAHYNTYYKIYSGSFHPKIKNEKEKEKKQNQNHRICKISIIEDLCKRKATNLVKPLCSRGLV